MTTNEEVSVQVTLSDEEKDRIAIGVIRRAIDDCDAQIAELLQHRINLSRDVQSLRVGLGEPRVQLQREQEVVKRYSDALGLGGRQIAHTILGVSKGPGR